MTTAGYPPDGPRFINDVHSCQRGLCYLNPGKINPPQNPTTVEDLAFSWSLSPASPQFRIMKTWLIILQEHPEQIDKTSIPDTLSQPAGIVMTYTIQNV